MRNKKLLLLSFLFMFILPAYSYEDIIISSPDKITDIKIEYNDIIDVYPLITLTNDKKILFVEPLKKGSSRFIVTKDKNSQAVFSVKVETDNTKVEGPEEFEIFALDIPPEAYVYEFDIDEPPEVNWTN